MTTMLEKMARALAMSDGYSEKEINASLGDPRLDVMPLYTDQARAALQAIREPDDIMVEAGHYSADWTTYQDAGEARESAKLVWAEMIDSILNEKPKPCNVS